MGDEVEGRGLSEGALRRRLTAAVARGDDVEAEWYARELAKAHRDPSIWPLVLSDARRGTLPAVDSALWPDAVARRLGAARSRRAPGGGGAKPRGGAKPKRSFADVMRSYERYDPSVEGYGSPEEWQGAFRQRLSADEARRVLKGRRPREVLGLGEGASWDDVRRAFRKLALAHHPDRVQGDADKARAHEEMKVLNAAYEALRHEFGT